MLGRASGLRWPLLVALIGAGVYLNGLSNGFALDDIPLVQDNPNIVSLRDLPGLFLEPYWPEASGGEESGLYRPVVIASFAINRALTGPGAFGFHAANVLAHALVCALVWLVARGSAARRGTTLLAALIFAVHPLHAEAVSNVSGRAELLGAMWVLLAWLLHRRAVAAGTTSQRIGLSACAALAVLLALLSKENTILAPLLFALDDRLPRDESPARTPLRQRLWTYALYAAALGLGTALRWVALGGLRGAETLFFIDNPAAFSGVGARWATALWVQVRYLGLFLWPSRLSSDYSYDAIPVVGAETDPRWIAGLLWAVLLVALFLYGCRRSRPLALAVAIWVLFFLPSSNLLFAAGTVMAERLAYLPSLGACLAVGHAASRLVSPRAPDRSPSLRARSALVIATAVVALAALAWRTMLRNPDWRDNETLATHDAEVMPRSTKLHAGVGIACDLRGDADCAEAAYRRALAIYPHYAQIQFNLGQLLAARGEREEAIRHLRRAAELTPINPRPHKRLAALLEREGRLDEALESYAAGSRMDPSDLSFRFNHGRALLVAGRAAEARRVLARLADEDPRGTVGRVARGLVSEMKGDVDSAAAIYRDLLRRADLAPEVRERLTRRLDAIERAGGPAG